MFCRHCGKEIDQAASVCPHCGAATGVMPLAYRQTNTLAIVGIITAFILPLVGLICSILGRKKAPKLGGSGQGLAVAGIVISVIYLFCWCFLFVLLLQALWPL